jgi:hypothetical protein
MVPENMLAKSSIALWLPAIHPSQWRFLPWTSPASVANRVPRFVQPGDDLSQQTVESLPSLGDDRPRSR